MWRATAPSHNGPRQPPRDPDRCASISTADPPIAPIAGGALDSERVTLTAADGNRLAAFRARAAQPSGAGIVILPDVRGLHPFYEELALRFAERGIDALAIDWFGRTAGAEPRGEAFEYMPHVEATTWAGIAADIAAGAEGLRAADGDRPAPSAVFTIGFCMGGRMSFLAGTLGPRSRGRDRALRHARPGRGGTTRRRRSTSRRRSPRPSSGSSAAPDASITPEAIAAFGAGLDAAGIDHELKSYPGAPHSFFDRKAAEFADASEDAWSRILAFVASRTG